MKSDKVKLINGRRFWGWPRGYKSKGDTSPQQYPEGRARSNPSPPSLLPSLPSSHLLPITDKFIHMAEEETINGTNGINEFIGEDPYTRTQESLGKGRS